MRETIGDLFSFPGQWVCIPTNGKFYDTTGFAIMGAGVALYAKNRYPGVDQVLGLLLQTKGNHVHLLGIWGDKLIFSFPTKENYENGSPIDLVLKSCSELRAYFLKTSIKPRVVLLPQVGCGYGRLKWENIRERVSKELPEDNFVVLEHGPPLKQNKLF